MTFRQFPWLLATLVITAGCDGDPMDPDAGGGTDACATCTADGGDPPGDGGRDAGPPAPDAGSDAGTATDAGTDGGTAPLPEPIVLALSAAGHDRLFGLTHDAAGNILGTGQIATGTTATEDLSTFVFRLSPDGALDDTFSGDGILIVNVTSGGRALETGRAIAVQSTGRIIVAGTTEHDPSAAGLLANDTDWFVLGVTPAGILDGDFGTAGIERINVNDAVVVTGGGPGGADLLAGTEEQWGLGIDSEDRIVLQGTSRNRGTGRTDTDLTMLRRLEDGDADEDFGVDGEVSLDIGMASASVRGVTVLADDSLVGVGYVTSTVLTGTSATAQQPVLYHLLENGAFDPDYATGDVTTLPGVWHDYATPAPGRLNAEAYGASPLSDGSFVTMGYGPTPGTGTGNDWVSFRFDADGDISTTYGTGGLTYIDTRGVRDSARNITTLPGDRTMSVGRSGQNDGSGGIVEDDLLVAVLSAAGVPDASFGAGGFRIFDVGLNDQLWAVDAFSGTAGDSAVVGGIAGAEAGMDDDSVLVIFPL